MIFLALNSPCIYYITSRYGLKKRSSNHKRQPFKNDHYIIICELQVQKIIGTKAFRRYATHLHTTPFPGCEKVPFDSDEYWECAIMQTSITLDHQV